MRVYSWRVLQKRGLWASKTVALFFLGVFLYVPDGSCNRTSEEQINRDARLTDSNAMLCKLFKRNCATTIAGPIVLWSGEAPPAPEQPPAAQEE